MKRVCEIKRYVQKSTIFIVKLNMVGTIFLGLRYHFGQEQYMKGQWVY